jgi:hypothetical protein
MKFVGPQAMFCPRDQGLLAAIVFSAIIRKIKRAAISAFIFRQREARRELIHDAML